MGIFADRVVSDADLTAAVQAAVADGTVTPAHKVNIKAAATGTLVFHPRRLAVGLGIAAVLLLLAVLLALQADAFAADQATKAAAISGYTAPTSSLSALLTTDLALLTAWSGALVTALFGDTKA
jgi:hypothetical protein